MKRQVVGFMFDSVYQDLVLLQKKARPEWMKGRFNGPGGKIEGEECIHAAIVREVAEETTHQSAPDDWTHFATIIGKDWVVYCLFKFTKNLYGIETRNADEPLLVINVRDLYALDTLHNLRWLIPMAKDQTIQKPVVVYDTHP